MSLFDIAMMAMHNLWTRRLRTVLNILGVVLASVVLAMMLAGTKGVSEGFDRMINDSEEVRRFAIYRSWQRNEEVPNLLHEHVDSRFGNTLILSILLEHNLQSILLHIEIQ